MKTNWKQTMRNLMQIRLMRFWCWEENWEAFCSAVYTEIRGSISYVQEQRMEYVVIGAELLIEIYNKFEEEKQPQLESLKEIFYWYASDYCDVFAADRIKDQIDPERGCFIVNMIMNEDLSDLRYLYRMGEYVGVNERETAAYLNSLSQEKIDKMADTFSEGYRIGFVNTGKDLSKKSVVNIYYAMGFERIVKKAIENFAKMGLKPSIFRTSHSVITRGRNSQIGFFNISGNKQYVYDHRDDIGLVMDKQYVERKLEVMRTTYEQNKEIAAGYAGPAVIDIFGEKTFVPQAKPEAVKLSEKQEELLVAMNGRAGRLTNEYLPGDERSFTIISWPVPEIGEQYHEIFDETIKINTLDYKLYQKVQQTMIDALDKGEYVKVTGSGENQTDLKVMLHPLADPAKETIFENCVADVNIPVGEVFTSPVLEGTEGTLFVSKVFLHGLPYYNLKISFKEGKITEYTCTNFDSEEENKKYIFDNILHNHQTLPIGEFAIGTNTTAYAVAKKYDIADKYTILIAEKTGPHFAVGDTCYSWAEDVKVYNPDGKEIIARDNSISILRKEDPSKAYFQCHTDITIPYDELGSIVVVAKDGTETEIIRDGRFVLPGTEILNEPLN